MGGQFIFRPPLRASRGSDASPSKKRIVDHLGPSDSLRPGKKKRREIFQENVAATYQNAWLGQEGKSVEIADLKTENAGPARTLH